MWLISLQTGTQNPLVQLTVVNLKKSYEQIKLTPPPSMKQMYESDWKKLYSLSFSQD